MPRNPEMPNAGNAVTQLEENAKLKRRPWILVAFAAILIWAFALDGVDAQRAEFLSLDSEGSSSVYTDVQRSTAFLLDGGRKGSLVRPRLDGKAALAALLDRGIKHLVITCSHPHDDHAAGLLEIIDKDSNITKFESVAFIDSEYPHAESLYRRFIQRWPQFPPDKVRYEPAKKRNAFAFLNSSEGNCKVSNFVYDSPNSPSNPHGQTIITTTELSKDGKTTRVVDFDDASSELVAQWAAWAKGNPPGRRPDVIVAPHHSSDLTEISPLLDQAIRPKACVITANSGNRFLHPGPANWLKLVNSLGAENIHVTATGNIAVTEKGLPAASREAFDAIRSQVIAPLVARVEKDRAIAAEQLLTGNSQSLQRKIDLSGERLKELRDLNIKYGGADDIPLPISLSKPPEPVIPSTGGSVSGGGIGNSSENGTAAFREKSQKLSSEARSPVQVSGEGRAVPARAMRFRAALKGIPIFGGVIIGNSTTKDSARPMRAEILLRKNVDGDGDAREEPVVHVIAQQDGKQVEGYWSDATATEIWAAYHIVHPNADWKVPIGECGIVGMVANRLEDGGSGWRFAVHPAVADTALALAAMRLDMFPAAIRHDADWREISALLPEFTSYRWIDEAARITIIKGKIQVAPKEGLDKCLLRLRFWRVPISRDPNSGKPEINDADANVLKGLVEKRLLAFKKAQGREPSDEENKSIIVDELKKFQEQGVEPEYDETKFLTLAFGRYDALQSVERLARAIAIFNWLSDSLRKKFPAWPPDCKPIRSAVVAKLHFNEVLPPK